MENPEKGKNPDEEDDGEQFDTYVNFGTKIRFGKKTWRKIALGIGALITGSFALGDLLRRLLERFWP